MSRVFKAIERLQKESGDLSSDFNEHVRAILLHPIKSERPGELTGEEALALEMSVEVAMDEPPPELVPTQRPELIRTLPIRLAAGSPLFPFERDRKAGEVYRLVRTKIARHPKFPALIVVSSADCGGGKTTSSINIAAALALKPEEKVLLVDADLRRGRIASLLGLPETPGLAEVLAGESTLDEAIIRIEQHPNLYVLCGGERLKSPAELLDSQEWKNLAVEFRKRFSHVILDTVPMGSIADYDLIETVSDGVLFVARPDHTNRSHCLSAINSIPKDRLIGVILNWVEDYLLNAPYYAYYAAVK